MEEYFSIQETITDTLRKEQEGRERQVKAWYASKLGSCLTGAYLERLGNPPDAPFDDRTLRIFSLGNLVEDWVLSKIEGKVEYETQERLEDKELDLVGRPDLIISLKKEKIIYEIKSQNTRSFMWMQKRKEPGQKHHRMQLWSYLHMTKIDEGRLLYVSKDNLALAEYPIFRSDKYLEGLVRGELHILNRAWKEKKAPPPLLGEKNWKNTYCSHHKQCVNEKEYLEEDDIIREYHLNYE